MHEQEHKDIKQSLEKYLVNFRGALKQQIKYKSLTRAVSLYKFNVFTRCEGVAHTTSTATTSPASFND